TTSVPPAKAMPKSKPLVTSEVRPGMMSTSESAKNQSGRRTMSSRRTLGSGPVASRTSGSGSAVSTRPVRASRLSSATRHSEDGTTAGPAEVQDDRQQVVGDDDRGEHAHRDTDQQGDREASHGPAAGEG